MRQVISISLPVKHARQLRSVAKRNDTSVSQYIQWMLDEDTDVISEEQLLRTIKRGEAQYERGEGIRAKSLKDLL